MDACTASTLRAMIFVIIAALAAWGIWSAHGEYTCAKAADPTACTKKSFGITAGILAVGTCLTTLVIVNSKKMPPMVSPVPMPSTTDLVANM